MTELAAAKPSLVIPSGVEAHAALRGNLDDTGRARVAAPLTAAVRDWTTAEAREALGLTPRPTAWVTSDVGDPLVFAENERRKIWAVLGDLSALDLIWNRTLLAVWKAPSAKAVGNSGLQLYRTDENRDNDTWQGSIAMVARLGPTAYVSGVNDETGESIYYPQAPKIGDWVYFARGYGTRVKINDFQCILLDKETESIKMRLDFPHAIDIT